MNFKKTYIPQKGYTEICTKENCSCKRLCFGMIELAKGDKKKEILDRLDSCSEKLLNGEWKAEWHKFCETVAGMYANNLDNKENPRFEYSTIIGHYLDCEAHTDVLREMYPTYNTINEK